MSLPKATKDVAQKVFLSDLGKLLEKGIELSKEGFIEKSEDELRAAAQEIAKSVTAKGVEKQKFLQFKAEIKEGWKRKMKADDYDPNKQDPLPSPCSIS